MVVRKWLIKQNIQGGRKVKEEFVNMMARLGGSNKSSGKNGENGREEKFEEIMAECFQESLRCMTPNQKVHGFSLLFTSLQLLKLPLCPMNITIHHIWILYISALLWTLPSSSCSKTDLDSPENSAFLKAF